MIDNHPTQEKKDSQDFYQIRIQSDLKNEFMQNCYELALNPSAVVRMLMADWTKKTSRKTTARKNRK
jgi:hypothetical protein